MARDQAYRNSLGEGAYVLDERGRLLELNPVGEDLLGWEVDALRGRDMHEAVHYLRADGTRFPREECPLLGVLQSGVEFAETHDTFVRADGSLLPVAYVSSPVLVDDEVVGAVWPSGPADAWGANFGAGRPRGRMDTDKLRSVLEAIPEGRWSSYADVVEAIGAPPDRRAAAEPEAHPRGAPQRAPRAQERRQGRA